jgi:hypothetical protein
VLGFELRHATVVAGALLVDARQAFVDAALKLSVSVTRRHGQLLQVGRGAEVDVALKLFRRAARTARVALQNVEIRNSSKCHVRLSAEQVGNV